MRLNPALLPAVPPPSATLTASLTLSTSLPPSPYPTTLTVLRPASTLGQPSTLQLPNGDTLEATLLPTLPAGAKLSVPPTTSLPATQLVTVSLPPSPRTVASTAVNPPPVVSPPALLALPTLALQAAPIQPTTTLPPGPLPVPTSQLATVLSALNRSTVGQPLTIMLVPTAANPLAATTPTFSAQLQGLPLVPGQAAPTLTLPAPLAGPTPAWVLPGGGGTSPVLLLGVSPSSPAIITNTFASAPVLPFTVISQAPLPHGQTLLARVIAPAAGGPHTPISQVPILLANGQTAALMPVNLTAPATSPLLGPLPSIANRGTIMATNAYLQPGSTLMVEFPLIAGAPRVQGVQAVAPQAHNAQNQGQLPGGTVPTTTPTALPAAQTILPSGTVVSGTITGQTPQGQPILTLSSIPLIPTNVGPQPGPPLPPGSQVALDLPEPLPLGSQLTLQLGATGQPATLLALDLPTTSQRAHTLSHWGAQWPGLQQALQALQGANPAAAHTLLQRLPQLANLLPGLLTMLASMHQAKEGTADTTFTESLGPLLKALGVDLSPDLTALQQLTQRQEDTPWRGMVFPYQEHPGEQPRQGGFFWRREGEDEDPRSPTATRFVVELSLSGQGPVQLDGLLTYPALWLKLRQTVPASPAYVQGLQSVVSSALGAHGLNGGITVDVLAPDAAFPVNPRAALLTDGVTHLPRSI